MVLASIGGILVIPIFANFAQSSFTNLQIPQNSQSVAGVQTYNLPPVGVGIQFPEIGARSILVKDLATDTILYQKDINFPVPIASTTKIMTALVGSDYFKPDSTLSVDQGAGVPGSKVGLTTGENLDFNSLLFAMLLNSGNDAAYTIAENYPGGVLGFVSAMNKKAQALNLRNTHFDNPAGFDSPNHFASAADLALITQEALEDPTLAGIFSTKETQVSSLDKKYTHKLRNLNQLLFSVEGVLGVKTGTTEAAKENLVTLVKRNNHRVLIIILGSDDRFGESTKVIEWVYQNFTWKDQETSQQ